MKGDGIDNRRQSFFREIVDPVMRRSTS